MPQPQKQTHRTFLQLLIDAALAFRPASGRSGAFSALGSFTPHFGHFYYQGPGSIQGRRKHAGEVRSIHKAQRRRAFYKSLRG